MPDNSKYTTGGRITVGSRVVVCTDPEQTDRRPGVVVEDYANEADMVGERLGRDWAAVRRWAVALDDGRLVFVDDGDLEAEPGTRENATPTDRRGSHRRLGNNRQ